MEDLNLTLSTVSCQVKAICRLASGSADYLLLCEGFMFWKVLVCTNTTIYFLANILRT